MNTAEILFLALLADAALGEPKWLWDRFPHPAVVMGRVIGWADSQFNTGAARRVNGVLVIVSLVVISAVLGRIVGAFGWLPELILAAILLAQRSLVEHVKAVGDALRVSLADGKAAVAQIVSRETEEMDESAVSRSAIESAAENLSDGVIAPAFWFLLGGLPGLLIYKIVNTADSMIGYRNEKYAEFGWAAARLDDVLNWIPARLTAALITGSHWIWSAWSEIREDAALHRSPNAGWPEAAMARALDIALAGPRTYDGVTTDFPYVNEFGQMEIGPNEIDAATGALWRSWAVVVILIGVLAAI